MKKEIRKKLESIVSKFPDSKILFALTTAIILGVLLYIAILFLSSK
ncbi:MAG: hypothetical protein AB9915_01835 [Candidatus Dojkabacteria bacterium]